ncbi:MAG: PilT/PilU family type 4a pilus ATPase [Chitinispirillales bacterium]|jgi:twitching motility protein PilT|nr:PilT/PilU family type 4a pilus ATPase [Chitinispirillales bacterium]
MDYKSLLNAMTKQNASDLHLRVGCPPFFRIHGTLIPAKMPDVTLEEMQSVLKEILTQEQIKNFSDHQEIDAGLSVPGVGRYRINVYSQRSTPAIAFRSIKFDIPPFDSLNVPEPIRKIAMKPRGLILVTGTTGSGKSTLLASMIDIINSNQKVNIISIEDPIEFLHRNKMATIAQREVGTDTSSYFEALKAAMRQDPDVILLGEIRDEETMMGALTAADTGHLVLSTLHTMNTTETVSRAVSFFSYHQHDQIRLMLSSVLAAVISMRLVPKKGGGLIPACEIMINNSNVEECLKNPDQLKMINEAIAAGNKIYGSQTFDQSLEQLYRNDLVEFDIAKAFASNPDDFELKVVGGISGASDRAADGFDSF